MDIIKNYIFDFDGTLMDTQGVILATIKKTIADLGLPPRTEEQCKSIIGIRTDEAAAVLYPELAPFNKEFAAAFRRNYEEIKSAAEEKTFPGVLGTLNYLHQNGYGLAIASSRRRSSLIDYLQGLGILDWFSFIVGADDVTNGKPNPEPVLKVLLAMDWKPENTIVVGDAPVDIEMGNAAGCYTCAVTYGNGSEADLQKANPDLIIDSFDGILDANCILSQQNPQ